MNYVLVLIDYLPDNLNVIVNSILSVDKDSKIYICSDENPNMKEISYINNADLKSSESEFFKELNIYKNTIFEENKLWMNSALRIFYLKEFLKDFKKEIVHFDNDVIIHQPYEVIDKSLINKNKLNITPASSKKLVFGYSVIYDFQPLNDICDEINKFALKGKGENWEFNNNKPFNEMQFLGNIYNQKNNLINLLPTLPYDSKLVFDPSNYGQYFDGTHTHPHKKFRKKKVYNINEDVDREIRVKRIKPNFRKGKPVVIWENESYDLVNIHVHSKRFSNFLPLNYKNFI